MASRELDAFNVGRRAKFLNMYIKAAYVIAEHGASPLGQFAHPPVDARVLEAALELTSDGDDQRILGAKWSKIDCYCDYAKIVGVLRRLYANRPFWHAEEAWRG